MCESTNDTERKEPSIVRMFECESDNTRVLLKPMNSSELHISTYPFRGEPGLLGPHNRCKKKNRIRAFCKSSCAESHVVEPHACVCVCVCVVSGVVYAVRVL